MMRRGLVGIVVVALTAAGCGGGDARTDADTSAPDANSPVTTSPVTTTPISTSPVTTSPVSTSPVTTSPVTTSPVTTSPVTTSPVTTSPVASGVVAEQLALVPDGVRSGADGLLIQLADISALAAIAGVTPPAPGRTADDIVTSLLGWERPAEGGVALPTPALLGTPQTWQFADEILAETGLDIGAVERVVTASAPPVEVTVTSGDLTLGSSTLTDVGGGVLSAGDGDDFTTDMQAAGGWRRIGQPVRFAQRDADVAWSSSTPVIEAWLAGPTASLADDVSYAALAAALDAHGAIGAVIAEADFGAARSLPVTASPAEVERFRETLPAIEPFRIAAAAAAPGGSFGAHALAAYVFADDDAAAAAVEPIGDIWANGMSAATGQPFADIVTVTSVEAIGPAVVVELEPVDARGVIAVADMLARADVVFAHP